MNFSGALNHLKNGEKLCRNGWNGKGMHVYLVNGSTFTVNRKPLIDMYPEGTVVDYRPHLDMRCADGTLAVWTVSQLDVLAEDWEVVK